MNTSERVCIVGEKESFPVLDDRNATVHFDYDAIRIKLFKDSCSIFFLREGKEVFGHCVEINKYSATVTFEGCIGRMGMNVGKLIDYVRMNGVGR